MNLIVGICNMDESQISAQWPPLIKHTEPYNSLFPRIEFENRDKDLEKILSIGFRVEISDNNTLDFIEASRRIREAVKHDAYLRWSSESRKKFEILFNQLKKLDDNLNGFEKHERKAFLNAYNSRAGSELTSISDLHQTLKNILHNKESLRSILDELPKTQKRSNTHGRSVLQRLAEAWTVIVGSLPNVYETGGKANSFDNVFENCLQSVGDYLNLSDLYDKNSFNASSIIQAYRKNPPPPDKI